MTGAPIGPANLVTAVRAVLVAAIAAAGLAPPAPRVAAAVVVVGTVAALLDLLDGWLARRTGTASAFGARFDMEVDAALILVLSCAGVAVRRDRPVGAAVGPDALRLRGRRRRCCRGWDGRCRRAGAARSVCVVQIVALLVALAPVVPGPLGLGDGGGRAGRAGVVVRRRRRLAARGAGSQRGGQVRWLDRVDGNLPDAGRCRWRRWSCSTPRSPSTTTGPRPNVQWYGHLSAELAAAVLLLALIVRRGPGQTTPRTPWTLRAVSAIWVALVVGRYFDVMAPALYGRPINLYWDLRHMSAVAAMMTDAVAGPLVAAGALGVGLVLWLLYLVVRRAFAVVIATLGTAPGQRLLPAASLGRAPDLRGADRPRGSPSRRSRWRRR